MKDLAEFVQPMIGTGGSGHTFPGATTPFGMVQLSPDTDIGEWKRCAGYHYDDPTILGFSHTHLSGTGVGDLGDVLVQPTVGSLMTERGSADNPEKGYRSRYSHGKEEASPGYYKVLLEDYQILAEMTATRRAGFHRYTFPESDSAHFIIDLSHKVISHHGETKWAFVQVMDSHTVVGYRLSSAWAKERYLYFAAKFSKPFQSYGMATEEENFPGEKYRPGKNVKAYLNFSTLKNEQVLVKVGLSGVSAENAMQNLLTEIPGWDFERVREEARQEWNKELNRIHIKADDKTKKVFYTSLYHSFIAPNLYMDANLQYRGLDQKIHEARDYTNHTVFSLWDTFRALHPLFTIIQQERTIELILSMMKHYEQHAYKMLPIWSLQAWETFTMIGYHAIPVIADTYLKDIEGFDKEEALQAMITTATRPWYDGLGYYMEEGYVPLDKEEEAASKTLEYAYDDWCIAQMAHEMGKEETSRRFHERSSYYKNIWDGQTGFLRGRNLNGEFSTMNPSGQFDPLFARYGHDYTEGNAWQYTWFVPHDMYGLIGLMGGKERFAKRLDTLFTLVAGQDEDAPHDITGLIGQYAHGNEPSHHVAYLYAFADKPWKTQERVRKIMDELYTLGPKGLPGNEDCGQMSAWYILSAMGFYPVNPAGGILRAGLPGAGRSKYPFGKWTCFFDKNERFFA